MSEVDGRNKASGDVEMANINSAVVLADKIESDHIINGIMKYNSEVEPEELSPRDSMEQQSVESRSFLKPQVRLRCSGNIQVYNKLLQIVRLSRPIGQVCMALRA